MRLSVRMLSLVLLGALVPLSGCGKKAGSSEPASAKPAAAPDKAAPAKAAPAKAVTVAASAEAKKFYDQVCVVCHGASGKGDGPGAANLKPKPRAFSDQAWQKSVTDEDLKKVILSGGLAVGKSAVMPGSPQLKAKPKVLDGLVAYVRSLGK